ncbi:hypothetical protein ACQEVB_35500 [Pseudonocardia sp. CA-107938]|uniref:hypothetical protein n=1 Tax=Pseudonocardia sp. CA-107938 TaxID=3240021 RepID=UPI003D8F6248
MDREPFDQIQGIAEILAASYTPEAVRGILAEHTPDESGHCRGCRLPSTAAPVWPCRLYVIGKESQRIKQARAAS